MSDKLDYPDSEKKSGQKITAAAEDKTDAGTGNNPEKQSAVSGQGAGNNLSSGQKSPRPGYTNRTPVPGAARKQQKKRVAGKRVVTPTKDEVETERKRIEYQKKYRKAIRNTFSVLVVVAAVAVLIATLVLPILQISGTSMEPTLENGNIVALFNTKSFETGELISFYYQGKVLIKRVIGGPGDFIDIDADGNVYVNDVLIDEPYLNEKAFGECDIELPYQVPENRYFVMGDNRETSIDSRSSVIGCVKKDKIIGKVFMRVWPLRDIKIY